MLMDTNGDTRMLLLKDLCSRLPYGVIVKYKSRQGEGDVQLGCGNIEYVSQLGNGWWKECKPYLRPMVSMSEEEKKEMHNLLSPDGTAEYINDGIRTPLSHFGDFIPYEYMGRVLDWLNAHHFDFRNLIEKGLAIAVTEENNPYKE